MAQAPIFPGTVKTPGARIQNSDGTSAVTVMTAGTSGAKIESIAATNTDTVPIILQIVATISAVDYTLGEVSIPAGAGTDGTTKAVDLLNVTALPWVRNDGVNAYMLLEAGAILKAKAKTAVTAGKVIHLFAQGGDF